MNVNPTGFRMKNKLITLAGTAIVLSLVSHFCAKPLLAAVAAITKNIDERGRNPYYQTVTCYNDNGNTCQAYFPQVPPHMRLVVEHINALLDTPTPLSLVDISGNGTIIQNPLLTLQGQDSEGNSFYIANQPFLTYFEAAQEPSVYMISQTAAFQFMSGQVTLSGYLVNLSE